MTVYIIMETKVATAAGKSMCGINHNKRINQIKKITHKNTKALKISLKCFAKKYFRKIAIKASKNIKI